MCSLALLRDNKRFVCFANHCQLLSWSSCAGRWGGLGRSRRTTIPRCVVLHNDTNDTCCLGPWSEVRRRVRLFLFIFWLSPRAEVLPIVVFHWVSEGGEGGVEPSHRQRVAFSRANLRLNQFRHYSIIMVTVIRVRLYVIIIIIITSPRWHKVREAE